MPYSWPWPEGHACRLKPSKQIVNPEKGISYSEGDLGKIIRSNDNNVEIWFRRTNLFHIIPKAIALDGLEVSEKKVGDPIEVIFDYPAPPSLPANALISERPTAFIDSARIHLQIWLKQRRFLDDIPLWAWDILGSEGERIETIVAELNEAIHQAGTAPILSDPDFEWTRLLKLEKSLEKHSIPKGGIYIQLYWGIIDEPQKLYVIIGSTKNFVFRYAQHRQAIKEQKKTWRHYQIAAKAKYREFRALAAHDNWIVDGSRAYQKRLFYEQLFINMFSSYRPDVVIDGAKGKWEVDYDPLSDDSVYEQIAEVFDFNSLGSAWSRVSGQANLLAGWKPPLQRASIFHTGSMELDNDLIIGVDQVTHGEGLNKQSPISTSSTYSPDVRTTWFRTEYHSKEHGMVYNFQRAGACRLLTPKSSSEQQNSSSLELELTTFYNKRGNSAPHVDITMRNLEDGPKSGDMVHVTVEIRLEGPHRIPFVCLPAIGPFNDWKIANSVAVKVTWNDGDNGRMEKYITRRRVAQFRRQKFAQSSGEFSGYNLGRALRRYLLQQPVLEGKVSTRPGDYDFGLPIIRRVDYDFFNQIVTISPPLSSQEEDLPSSQRKDARDIVAEMEKEGLQNVGLRNQDLPQGFFSSLRKNCDCCYLRNTILASSDTKCTPGLLVSEPGSSVQIWSCDWCLKRGIPCSWTNFEVSASEIKQWSRALKQNPSHPVVGKLANLLLRHPYDNLQSVSTEEGIEVDEDEQMTETDPQRTQEDFERLTSKAAEEWEQKLE